MLSIAADSGAYAQQPPAQPDAAAQAQPAQPSAPAQPEAPVPKAPASNLIVEKGDYDKAPEKPAFAERPRIDLPKQGTFEISVSVDAVSQPVNPRETIMTVEDADGKAAELILAPVTRFVPFDYYPCEGDTIKVAGAVVGAFNKRIFAYSVSLVGEAKRTSAAGK